MKRAISGPWEQFFTPILIHQNSFSVLVIGFFCLAINTNTLLLTWKTLGALTSEARADDRVAEKIPAEIRGPKPDTRLITCTTPMTIRSGFVNKSHDKSSCQVRGYGILFGCVSVGGPDFILWCILPTILCKSRAASRHKISYQDCRN